MIDILWNCYSKTGTFACTKTLCRCIVITNNTVSYTHLDVYKRQMQRDIMEGKRSEIDGLVYEVVRMGEKYHVPVPAYEKVAEKLKAL